MRALDLPALIVRGGDSNVLTAAALPQGWLVTVPDCGHNVHSQNTRGFLELVRRSSMRPRRGLAVRAADDAHRQT